MKKKFTLIFGISILLMACSLSSFPVQEKTPTLAPETPMILEGTSTIDVSFPESATSTPTLEPYPSESLSSDPSENLKKTILPTPTEPITFRSLQTDFLGDEYKYVIQSISPAYLPNFAHPKAGCNWMGVAGQIFDEEGYPQEEIVVVVEGVIGTETIEALGFSSLAQVYGPGGYEVVLSDRAAPGLFWVQLFNLSGEAVSEIVQFEMNGACEQNLALINFYRSQNQYELFVPLIVR